MNQLSAVLCMLFMLCFANGMSRAQSVMKMPLNMQAALFEAGRQNNQPCMIVYMHARCCATCRDAIDEVINRATSAMPNIFVIRIVSASRKIEAQQFIDDLNDKALADDYSYIKETNKNKITDAIQLYNKDDMLMGQYAFEQVENIVESIKNMSVHKNGYDQVGAWIMREEVVLKEDIMPLIDPRPVAIRKDTLLVYNYMKQEVFMYDLRKGATQSLVAVDLNEAIINVPQPWSVRESSQAKNIAKKYEIVSAALGDGGELSLVVYIQVSKYDTSYSEGESKIVKTINHLPLYCKIILNTGKLAEYQYLPQQYDRDIFPLYKNCIVMDDKIFLTEPFYYSYEIDYKKIQRIYVYDIKMNRTESYTIPLECSHAVNLGTNYLSLNVAPLSNNIYLISSLDNYIYDINNGERYLLDTEHFTDPCSAFADLEDEVSNDLSIIDKRAFSVEMRSVNTGLVALSGDMVGVSQYVAGLGDRAGTANIIVYSLSHRIVEYSFAEPSTTEYRLIQGSSNDAFYCMTMKDDIYCIKKYVNSELE